MNVLAVASYGTAFVAFIALAAFAVYAPANAYRPKLLLALCISALWALLPVVGGYGVPISPMLVLLAEVLRDGAWTLVLLALSPPGLPRPLRSGLYVLFGVWAILGLTFLDPMIALVAGGLLASLCGLILLEQVYRNTTAGTRREVWFLAIGVGGFFAYDIFLYSQAVLMHGIDRVSWEARGFVNALLVPFLAIGIRRLPAADRSVYVSRQVTFYTSMVLAIGVYTLLMAGAGYVIHQLGGRWGEMARLVFFVGAIGVLLVLIASGSMRRQLRVFVSKHFYRYKYDYRAEWLQFIRTLSSTNASDARKAAVQSVAQILGAPGGLLYTLDLTDRRYEPAGAWPIEVGDVPEAVALGEDDPLVTFMRKRRWIVDLREREAAPALYDDVPVPEWLARDRRWRLVSPIFRLDSLVGFFVFFEPPGNFELTYEDRDLLNTAGQHVATLLGQYEADRRVAELSQFEAYNRLTAFVMHDLKNSAAQLSLVVGNAVKHKHNPEFIDDAIATIANTSERITRLIGHLRRGTVETAPRPVPLADAVSAAVERCQGRMPAPVFAEGRHHTFRVAADRDRLIAALEHVIRNAQDATPESGTVRVEITTDEENARIIVADTGRGMEAEFIRNRLFRPFDTTKGSKGMGIGAYQARELARSLGGRVEVDSRPGDGTRFVFVIPAMP